MNALGYQFKRCVKSNVVGIATTPLEAFEHASVDSSNGKFGFSAATVNTEYKRLGVCCEQIVYKYVKIRGDSD